MRNFILGFVAALVLAGGGYWIGMTRPFGGNESVANETIQKYHCPMHPTYVSDRPGDCPICGMRLVPIEADSTTADESAPDEHAGHESAGEDTTVITSDVPGYSTVRLTAEKQQLMGIKLTRAEAMPLQQTIRTFGRVTIDETRLHHVHTKFEGYIERLYANYVGQFVKKGQPLFSVYSPELYATQKEYLLALRAREQLGNPADRGNGLTIDLVGAARQRLELWDIGDDEIKRLEESRQPQRQVIITSPVTGYIRAKTAVEGLRVMPGDTLYEVVDLSSVWVLADIYEITLPFVRIGQRAEMTLPYHPGRKLSERVTYIDPTVDEATRTVKARIEFSNPEGLLKPEMYADVIIHGLRRHGVAVPDEAVMSTGERHIVFVAKGNGLFEPRKVTLGVKVRNLYEITDGVSPGEQVVIGANFLLDSESRLKATLADTGTAGAHQHGE